MANWMERIVAALGASGCQTRVWDTTHGRLLVVPYGARLLGCEVAGVEGNLFWHNSRLEDAQGAKLPLQQASGSLGGDRLWVGPEVAYMWPDLKLARKDPPKHHRVLPQMDPADWRIVEDQPGHLRLTTQMTLTDARTDKNITLRLARQFGLIGAPSGLSRRIKAVSFAIRNEATLLEADPGAVGGTWDLLQLPTAGVLVCPTLAPVKKVQSYYRPFQGYVKTDRRAVRFTIDGRRRVKMGLSPTQTTGRMGYFRKVGKVATLIVRVFPPLPGEPYVDVPLSSKGTFGGDVLQAYNDEAGAHSFGEMEYHDAALVGGCGPSSRVTNCITHVLAGPEAEIKKAGAMLLGI